MELELGKPCPYCGEGSMIHDAGDAIGYYCSNGFKCKMFLKAPWNADPAHGAMEEFTAPKHLRKGQALFLFINWLGANRKAPQLSVVRIPDGPNHAHFIFGDTFDIPDDRLAKLWDEFVERLGEKHE